jgi:hypothetical protein
MANVRAVETRTRIQFGPGCGPPLGAPCRDDSREFFGDSHQAHPSGIAGATCSACGTKLTRWGSPGVTLFRIFWLPPALAGLRLLLRLYLIGRRRKTDFLRPRFLARLQVRHQEALPTRTEATMHLVITLSIEYFKNDYGSCSPDEIRVGRPALRCAPCGLRTANYGIPAGNRPAMAP